MTLDKILTIIPNHTTIKVVKNGQGFVRKLTRYIMGKEGRPGHYINCGMVGTTDEDFFRDRGVKLTDNIKSVEFDELITITIGKD